MPVRANTLTRLLEVLTTSLAHSKDREELREALGIGIQFGGYQLSKSSNRLKAASGELKDSLGENISLHKESDNVSDYIKHGLGVGSGSTTERWP